MNKILGVIVMTNVGWCVTRDLNVNLGLTDILALVKSDFA
jgi:hypothetical protein